MVDRVDLPLPDCHGLDHSTVTYLPAHLTLGPDYDQGSYFYTLVLLTLWCGIVENCRIATCAA